MRSLPLVHVLPLVIFLAGCSAHDASYRAPAVQSSGASETATGADIGTARQVPRGALTPSDVRFIMAAGYFTAGEWRAGQAAISHSPSSDLRAFASILTDDSFRQNQALERLAAAKGFQSPLVPDEQRSTRLRILEAQLTANFDQRFIADQIDEHQASIPIFQAAANDLPDADLRDFAGQTLPNLVQRLDTLRSMAAIGMDGRTTLAASR